MLLWLVNLHLAGGSVGAASQPIGFLSIINTNGEGVLSTMTTSQGVSSLIDPSEGIDSIIVTDGQGVLSTINPDGVGVNSGT